MKNLFKPALLVLMMTVTLPSVSNATSNHRGKINPIEKIDSEESQKMVNRLKEINAMDRKSLTRSEKRELRHEVKSIQRELRTKDHGGVYISVGAAIIIVLLLILIF